eukprot:4786106-Prymnesium_polylepis.1
MVRPVAAGRKTISHAQALRNKSRLGCRPRPARRPKKPPPRTNQRRFGGPHGWADGASSGRRPQNDLPRPSFLVLRGVDTCPPGCCECCDRRSSAAPPSARRGSARMPTAKIVSDVRIRLQRFGRKRFPFYRIVATHKYAPRDGKFHEILGTYNPTPDRYGAKHVTFNVERLKYWLVQGAAPSERVMYLLGRSEL